MDGPALLDGEDRAIAALRWTPTRAGRSASDRRESQLSVKSCPRNHLYRTIEQTAITRLAHRLAPARAHA